MLRRHLGPDTGPSRGPWNGPDAALRKHLASESDTVQSKVSSGPRSDKPPKPTAQGRRKCWGGRIRFLPRLDCQFVCLDIRPDRRSMLRSSTKPHEDLLPCPNALGTPAEPIRGGVHDFGSRDDPQAALGEYLTVKDDLPARRPRRLRVQEMGGRSVRSRGSTHRSDMIAPVTASPPCCRGGPLRRRGSGRGLRRSRRSSGRGCGARRRPSSL